MELNDREQDALRRILEGFYSPNIVAEWEMNERVLKVLGEMLTATEQCSRLMDLVPRPTGYCPSLSCLRRKLIDIARRVRNNEGTYLICKSTMALKKRTDFEVAGQGL